MGQILQQLQQSNNPQAILEQQFGKENVQRALQQAQEFTKGKNEQELQSSLQNLMQQKFK